jgi:hypothetical protein
LGEHRLRGGGPEDDQQLLLQVAQQLENVDAGPGGDGAEHDQDEEQGGGVEGQHQLAKTAQGVDAVFADGEGHGAEGANRGGVHDDADDAEERLAEPLDAVRRRCASWPPARSTWSCLTSIFPT